VTITSTTVGTRTMWKLET